MHGAYRKSKIDGLRTVLNNVRRIVIDESSMVRCDLVDAINKVLKRAFHPKRPFGGKQIIFFGDLRQLPPVVKDESEEKMMIVDSNIL